MLKNGSFCLERSCIEKEGPKGAREAFKQFYVTKGTERFGERVTFYAPKVGVEPGTIKVKEMGYRWASCGAGGNLNFHWKCMMAPPRIIDYIVVHELCHLHHRNHSEAFWNEIDKVMPDYRERKDWLRRHGVKLDL
jgi:predicted metal-dependent hydrolase